jgi:hypothetical protein
MGENLSALQPSEHPHSDPPPSRGREKEIMSDAVHLNLAPMGLGVGDDEYSGGALQDAA